MNRFYLIGLFLIGIASLIGCGETQSSSQLTSESKVTSTESQPPAPQPPTISNVTLIKSGSSGEPVETLSPGVSAYVVAVFSITNPNIDAALWQSNIDIVAKDANGKVLGTNKGSLGHAQDTIPLVPPNTTWVLTNSNLAHGSMSTEDLAQVAKVEVNIDPKWKSYDPKKMGPLNVSGVNAQNQMALGQVLNNLTSPVKQVLFYATVSRDGKIVGAARNSIYDLKSGQTQPFEFLMTGETAGELQVLALPLER